MLPLRPSKATEEIEIGRFTESFAANGYPDGTDRGAGIGGDRHPSSEGDSCSGRSAAGSAAGDDRNPSPRCLRAKYGDGGAGSRWHPPRWTIRCADSKWPDARDVSTAFQARRRHPDPNRQRVTVCMSL